MKFLIVLTSLLFSFSLFASAFKTAPNCYKGKLNIPEGPSHDVLMVLKSVEGDLVRVEKFKVGSSMLVGSGTLLTNNEIIFNYNNDYIPGGNATYNIDVYLKNIDGKLEGFYKEYRFEHGEGGFANSDPRSLMINGIFELKECVIRTIIE